MLLRTLNQVILSRTLTLSDNSSDGVMIKHVSVMSGFSMEERKRSGDANDANGDKPVKAR